MLSWQAFFDFGLIPCRLFGYSFGGHLRDIKVQSAVCFGKTAAIRGPLNRSNGGVTRSHVNPSQQQPFIKHSQLDCGHSDCHHWAHRLCVWHSPGDDKSKDQSRGRLCMPCIGLGHWNGRGRFRIAVSTPPICRDYCPCGSTGRVYSCWLCVLGPHSSQRRISSWSLTQQWNFPAMVRRDAPYLADEWFTAWRAIVVSPSADLETFRRLIP
jgi:hypothetical protein